MYKYEFATVGEYAAVMETKMCLCNKSLDQFLSLDSQYYPEIIVCCHSEGRLTKAIAERTASANKLERGYGDGCMYPRDNSFISSAAITTNGTYGVKKMRKKRGQRNSLDSAGPCERVRIYYGVFIIPLVFREQEREPGI